MAHKIAFIGAGSFGFTRSLVRDLLSFPAFHDATISLMDINAERLAAIKAFSSDLTIYVDPIGDQVRVISAK